MAKADLATTIKPEEEQVFFAKLLFATAAEYEIRISVAVNLDFVPMAIIRETPMTLDFELHDCL
jgi:hypothetical protein